MKTTSYYTYSGPGPLGRAEIRTWDSPSPKTGPVAPLRTRQSHGAVSPLGAYIDAIKWAKANPMFEFLHGLTTRWPTTGAEILRQFRHGMQDRINQDISYHLRGDPRRSI